MARSCAGPHPCQEHRLRRSNDRRQMGVLGVIRRPATTPNLRLLSFLPSQIIEATAKRVVISASENRRITPELVIGPRFARTRWASIHPTSSTGYGLWI